MYKRAVIRKLQTKVNQNGSTDTMAQNPQARRTPSKYEEETMRIAMTQTVLQVAECCQVGSFCATISN